MKKLSKIENPTPKLPKSAETTSDEEWLKRISRNTGLRPIEPQTIQTPAERNQESISQSVKK